MIISLNWLKKYVDIDVSIDELKEKIGRRLVEIEGIENWAEKYAGLPVVQVKKCKKIAGADKLTLTLIDDGGVVRDVERDSDGLVQVVCGAPNVREGMLTVWFAPGMTIPTTIGSDEPFVMESRKVFGQMSHGMLAGTDEIFPGEEHLAIIELDPAIAKAGDDFATVYEMDDYLLEVENKSLTHRPDCFGIIGFAREIAGILGKKFVEPEVLQSAESQLAGARLVKDGERVSDESRNDGHEERRDGNVATEALLIEIPDPELCPRYSAAVIDLGESGQEIYADTDKYLSIYDVHLYSAGMRPIGHIVDLTNHLMLSTGQPLHAFDYDKFIKVGGIDNPKVIVRAAKKGEKLELLNGKIIELDPKDIIITSNDVPVALAGAMGGKNTEIDANTKRIIIESATFNLYNLRATQFRHGIFSEAITRFTKGQPAAIALPTLNQVVKILSENGEQLIDIFDAYPKPTETKTIDITIGQINALLGSDFDYRHIEKTLTNIGFSVACECGDKCECGDDCKCDKITVKAPFWRIDINIPEDIIEEVGRINGFETLSLQLPTREYKMVESNKMMVFKDKIREWLAAAGANEVLTYSFVSEDLLKKVGQDPANSYELANSISPELRYIRQQIAPNLLVKTYENLRAGYDRFALFEINQIFQKELGLTDEDVPKQYDNLAFAIADKDSKTGFYDAKNYLVRLGEKLGVNFEFRTVKKMPRHEDYFEPKRSAFVFIGDVQVGVIGELRASVQNELKLPAHTAAFEIGLNPLIELAPDGIDYKPIPKFPGTTRDICFQVSNDVKFADVANILFNQLNKMPDNFVWKISPVDIYSPTDGVKNITLHIEFHDRTKTIDTDFVGQVIDEIAHVAKQTLDAKIM